MMQAALSSGSRLSAWHRGLVGQGTFPLGRGRTLIGAVTPLTLIW